MFKHSASKFIFKLKSIFLSNPFRFDKVTIHVYIIYSVSFVWSASDQLSNVYFCTGFIIICYRSLKQNGWHFFIHQTSYRRLPITGIYSTSETSALSLRRLQKLFFGIMLQEICLYIAEIYIYIYIISAFYHCLYVRKIRHMILSWQISKSF